MAIAHGYLATRIAWIDDEQVFLRVTEAGDAAQLDFACRLAVWDAYPPDVDQVEITAAAVPIGIDLGAVGGQRGVRLWPHWRWNALVQRTSRDSDSLLNCLGQLRQLLPPIAIVREHLVQQAQTALHIDSPFGQQFAHLPHLRAQLEQVEGHQQGVPKCWVPLVRGPVLAAVP